MAVEGEAGTTNGPGEPLDLRGGVPDDRLASRDLLVLGGVEIAHTRYLPNEMEVPPLRGHTVNLRLGGKGRVITRFGGRKLLRPPSPCTCCASILRSASAIGGSLLASPAASLRAP